MISTRIEIREVPTRFSTSEPSRSEDAVKRSCYGLRKLLDNKYSEEFSDGEGSALSFQNHETEVPYDTPCDDASSEYCSSDVVDVEYECVSESDRGSFRSDISTGDEATLAAGVISAILCDSSLESYFTDSEEDSDNSSVEGVKLEKTKWRLCIQCKGENNNPLYRYCQKCFQKRKELFPPWPRGFKKRDEVKKRIKKKCKAKVCSQDSGIVSLDSDILQTQSEQNGLKRRRPLHSDTEEFESESENSKKIPKLDLAVIGDNNNLVLSDLNDNGHEVPVLNNHSDQDFLETCKKSVDTPSNNSWITKAQDEKKNNEYDSGSFAVTKELCMMCATVTRDSIFLHGSTGHVVCCYRCSVKTWKTTKCCPVCKAKVRNVIKVIFS